MPHTFLMTGGGTGGHVFPALAVADVLRGRGHNVLYAGTAEGMEATIVPQAGYEMFFIRSGGMNRVGLRRQLQSSVQVPLGLFAATRLLRRLRPKAVFSTGGYVAAPTMAAAVLNRIPLIIMEPNAMPGFANRKIAKRVYRALLGFDAAKKWFPPGRSEVSGVPVRAHFFGLCTVRQNSRFTVLVTGGSRGSKTLNSAARDSWPLFREAGAPVRMVLQTGTAESASLADQLASSGLEGEVAPFIRNMPEAFAQADLVVCRSGASAVNELAAAGMASILVPFPFAADDHQRKNAEALVEVGGARLVPDREMSGERLFAEVENLRTDEKALADMRMRILPLAKPAAAARAADVLEEAASVRVRR